MKEIHRLEELDALRGFAAVAVVFYHYTLYYKEEAIYYYDLFIYGRTGVDLFFLISGFVIFLTVKRANSWKQFALARISRLYPTYWAAIFFTISCLAIVGHLPSIKQVAANLSMIQYLFNVHDIDRSYWTLYIEMQFYLIIGLLLALQLTKHMYKICHVLLVLLMLFYLTSPLYAEAAKRVAQEIPLLTYFPLFISGIFFYKLKTEEKNLPNHLSVAAGFLAVLLTYFANLRSIVQTTVLADIGILLFYYGLFLLFVYKRLLFVVNPISLFYGKISYSLYLIHQSVSAFIFIPTFMHKLQISFWPAALLSFALCTFIAYLITTFVEQPALKAIRSYSKNRKAI